MPDRRQLCPRPGARRPTLLQPRAHTLVSGGQAAGLGGQTIKPGSKLRPPQLPLRYCLRRDQIPQNSSAVSSQTANRKSARYFSSLRGSERQSLAGAIRNWRAACHFVSRSVLCFQSARWHAPPRSWSKQYNDMAPSHFSSRRGRWIALITAGLGTAHFAISVFLWALLAGKGLLGRPDWPRICTAIVLLGASITAFSLAWKRLRVSQVLILGALLLATGSFWHDVSHHRYQLRGWLAEGEYTYDYTYLTWWWYEERRAGWSDLQQHPYQVRTWSILGLAGHTWRHYEEHPSKTK